MISCVLAKIKLNTYKTMIDVDTKTKEEDERSRKEKKQYPQDS
jgi:hypothetical protein